MPKFDASPQKAVKLVFVHHSCGRNWLCDTNGGLGIALKENNYFVSDTYYGWGPDNIGDHTDIGHWWSWFCGPDSGKYTAALYGLSDRCSDYSRLEGDPGGENVIVLFKSCYPNSKLKGSNDKKVPDIVGNTLKGMDCSSEYHTIENAKGIYISLLEYFKTRQDKLFIAITAPPVIERNYANNARSFNTWLSHEWLKDYPYKNVGVFDFYNILADKEDNSAKYPTAENDSHPNPTGNQKATEGFIPVLNILYNCLMQENNATQGHGLI